MVALVSLVAGFLAGILGYLLDSKLLGSLVPEYSPAVYHEEPGLWTRVVLSLCCEAAVGVGMGVLFRRQPLAVVGVALLTRLYVALPGSDPLLLAMQCTALLSGTLLVWLPWVRPWPRVHAVAKGCTAVVVITVVATFFLRWYGPHRSSRQALALCESTGIGDDRASVFAQARVRGMHQRLLPGPGHYEFWVDGFLGAHSTCEVRFERDRVAQRDVQNYLDLANEWVKTIPSD
jgi:hypothetical protein